MILTALENGQVVVKPVGKTRITISSNTDPKQRLTELGQGFLPGVQGTPNTCWQNYRRIE